jgi:hypothetical protein
MLRRATGHKNFVLLVEDTPQAFLLHTFYLVRRIITDVCGIRKIATGYAGNVVTISGSQHDIPCIAGTYIPVVVMLRLAQGDHLPGCVQP